MALKQVVIILAVVIGLANSCANTCRWANDGDCDEPSICSQGTDCMDCGFDYTQHPHRRRTNDHLYTGSSYTYNAGCTWDDDDTDEFTAKIMTGSIIAAVLGVIFLTLVSLPLCCGVMMGLTKPQVKILAGVVMGCGIFIIFIPYFASLSACDPVAEDICASCDQGGTGCTDAQKSNLETECNALGAYLVYYYAYGWLSVILGITAASLSCCILCNCCKMADDVNAGNPMGGPMGAPPPVVVGSPVEGTVVTPGDPPQKQAGVAQAVVVETNPNMT